MIITIEKITVIIGTKISINNYTQLKKFKQKKKKQKIVFG